MRYFLILLTLFTFCACSLKTEKGSKSGKRRVDSQEGDELELIEILPRCLTIVSDNGTLIETEEGCTYESIINRTSISSEAIELDIKYIGKRIKLNKSGYDSVMIILNENLIDEAVAFNDCYWPRNGIIRYNSQGKMIGFLEVCFECGNSKVVGNMPNGHESIDLNKLKELLKLYELKIE